MAKTRATRSSAPKSKAKPAKKNEISKKAPAKKVSKTKSAPKSKPAAKAVKKEVVPPKKNLPAKSSTKLLDLCLILDCTGSMSSWIQRSKDTLKQIIESVINENSGLTVRAAFVAYRDVQDHPRFDVTDFTENIDQVKAAISRQAATGGGDFPEDVQGGFNKALGLSWAPESVKIAFHIADAPGHGKDICEHGDSHPKGSPDGFKI